MRGRERGIVELVEQPELRFEQEGAVERLVGVRDFAEQRELRNRLLVGRLKQRPPGALDPAADGGVRALVRVPLIAADLVDRALAEPDDVERIERDLAPGRLSRIAFS